MDLKGIHFGKGGLRFDAAQGIAYRSYAEDVCDMAVDAFTALMEDIIRNEISFGWQNTRYQGQAAVNEHRNRKTTADRIS